MISNNLVLFLKSQTGTEDDKYRNLIRTNGFNVKQAQTLVFEFKCLEKLEDKLKNANHYQGFIFSSPRCVQAVSLALKNDIDIQHWKTKCNFVVGEATYQEALDKLGLECQGKETGNAENLAKFMLESKNLFDKPFLFPHGNLKTDTLSRELRKENITMEEVLVYDTVPNPNIEKELAEITDNFQTIPEYIVFFSPSGLRSSLNFLRRVPDFNSAKLIAIGPVTELAMSEENLTIYGVAKKPTPQDILQLIVT